MNGHWRTKIISDFVALLQQMPHIFMSNSPFSIKKPNKKVGTKGLKKLQDQLRLDIYSTKA